MKRKWISFVESVIDSGSRIRERTVFAHLPHRIVEETDELVASHPSMSRGAALWFVLTGRPVPSCASCGKPLKFSMWPDRREHGYKLREYRHCSSKCYGKNCKKGSSIQLRREATNIERYGAAMPQQSEVLKQKQQQTMLDRYGEKFSARVASSIRKREQTVRKRYGPSARRMFAERSVVQRAKDPQSLREYYESWANAHSQMKTLTLDGKSFLVRGYEPQAIRILHKKGVSVDNILTTAAEGVPSIAWKDGRFLRAYHPDFLITEGGRNVLVEVKSAYTCGLRGNRQLWNFNKKKFKASKREGYELVLMVVDRYGSGFRAKIFKDPHKETVRSLRRALELK